MATEYNWKILKIDTESNALGEVISAVLWELVGTDSEDGVQGVFTTKTPLLSPLEEQFIELGQVTEEMLVEWVEQKSSIEIEDEEQKIHEPQFVVEHAKQEVQKMIELKRSRKNNLPWQ